MVGKLMWWPPLPPSRKYESVIVVSRLEGLNLIQFDDDDDEGKEMDDDYVRKKKKNLVVEIKWKGQKTISLSQLRKSVKRNFTEEGGVCGDGIVEWNEEFQNICNFSGYTDTTLLPWEVDFTIFNGSDRGLRNKVRVVGTASLNLAEYFHSAKEMELEVKVPLIVPNATIEDAPSLCLLIRLMESRTARVSSRAAQRLVVPITSSPSSVEALSVQKDELSAVKAGLRKMKMFKDYVSARRAKKACHEEEGSDGVGYSSPFDTDSVDEDDAEAESDESKKSSSVQQFLSYETLASANWAGGSCHTGTKINPEDEGWIYYSKCKSDEGCLCAENTTTSVYEQSSRRSMKRRILPWRKRKMSFRSRKNKGEPLLNIYSKEVGGDDIDFDRRQLSSSDDLSYGWYKSEGSTTSRSSFSEFGDDNFCVGSWEHKEVISRDGRMKLQAKVFFASIDQRSERAAGESACTALVAVTANWLQANRDEMPIKSEFDSLIREGSLEWRNLCENEDYIQRFPDKHFDLETILEVKIRSLSVVPEKSFIGFFHPEGLEGEGFDFLDGAMSFDSIWEEIIRHGSDLTGNVDPLIYIVSWNDHFFVLKVEQDAYYIIDTLGERLYEGCNQAYILKFDKDTIIERLPEESKPSDEKSASDKAQASPSKKNPAEETRVVVQQNECRNNEEVEVVCRGKESCKEYIKSFLASIPIRELQADIKRGLMASTPLHHRLQIEFHYTQLLPAAEFLAKEMKADAPRMVISLAAA